MGSPTNQEIYDLTGQVKGIVADVKSGMLTSKHFDEAVKGLKAGSGSGGSKDKEEGGDWKTTASDTAGLVGLGDIVKNILDLNVPVLASAVFTLFSIKFIAWDIAFKKSIAALSKDKLEQKADSIIPFGKKSQMPRWEGQVRPQDIQTMRDARTVAVALARSLHDLTREMQQTSSAS